MNFLDELKWRGLLHDVIPGTEELLNEKTSGYIGFDPTSDSLHIGSLSQIMTLIRFAESGHNPIILIGGATGMVGDPSGKSDERNLLDFDQLNNNIAGIQAQLSRLVPTATIVNNYDWFKNFSFLDFIREAGKNITVNYMLAKDSVKKRIESGNGMSFTEFSYQLIQGYDFLHLYKEHNCKLQIGGTDQWGNMTTGTDFIRKKLGSDAFAITTKLITKSDGSKFGKTEGGNIWLDPKKTSPYKFYQFWLNVSDEDAESFIKIFTLLDKGTIEDLITKHKVNKSERILQKELAKWLTIFVHSEEDFNKCIETSSFLFKSKNNDLVKLDSNDFKDKFYGIDAIEVEFNEDPVQILVDSKIIESKSKARELLKANSISFNKNKISLDKKVQKNDFLLDKYILISKGKKENFLISLR